MLDFSCWILICIILLLQVWLCYYSFLLFKDVWTACEQHAIECWRRFCEVFFSSWTCCSTLYFRLLLWRRLELCCLCYYAVSSGNLLLMLWDNLSVPSSRDWMGLKMGLVSCPKTSVRNYHHSLCNNPGEHSTCSFMVLSVFWYSKNLLLAFRIF